MTDLTPKQRSALLALRRLSDECRDGEGVTTRAFSKAAWPDSMGHRVSVKTGAYGSTSGRQMWSAGGAYLARLRKLGYADLARTGWRITMAGRRALDD